MSQTERIAYLDRRLRERGWVTAAEVASAFEVSTRQVKRDIEYLRWRLDAPVAYDPLRRRYHYEKPYARLRFVDERRVLFSALVKGWAASPSVRPWVTPDLFEGLSASVSREYRVVADRIRYEAPSSEPMDLELFAGLCRGIRDRRIVELEYVNLSGEPSRRRVEAQRLIHYEGVWYLVAFDHLRDSLRTFHLGRVKALTVTSDPVTRSDSDPGWAAQVEAWTGSGFGIFQGGTVWTATVRLRGPALRVSAAQRWHPDQTDARGADDQGEWLDRSVPVVDARELVRRVLALGGDAEARSPGAFRDLWVAEVRRMARLVESALSRDPIPGSSSGP